MKSSDYWALREIQDREALINTAIIKTEKQMAYQYRRASLEIERLIIELYDKIQREAGTDKALISDLYKFNRYYELLDNLNIELKKLGSKEKTILGKELKELYTNNSAIVGKQLGISTYVDPKMVNKVINNIWCSDGVRWSNRIWTHKRQLVQTLTNGLIDCVATGVSHDTVVKMVMGKMGTSYNNASRLVRTELSHIYNQATFDKYSEAGIEQYRFLTAQDERTCEQCSPLNMQVFNMEDAEVGVNYPPLHPNCRCTVLAVLTGVKDENN